jgi:hypothetical protein
MTPDSGDLCMAIGHRARDAVSQDLFLSELVNIAAGYSVDIISATRCRYRGFK